MYSPQEHTFTTRSDWTDRPVTTSSAVSTQAMTPAATRRSTLLGRRWCFIGAPEAAVAAAWCSRRAAWLSRRLMMASSTSTVTNSRVEMALISGLTRFLVMP